MTRTVFFGKASEENKKIYDAALESQKKAIEYINQHTPLSEAEILRRKAPQDDKGIKAQEVDKVAREYIVSKNFPSIPHSLGHGIGLEVHEAPRLSPGLKDEELKIGMVFSIEPGIYIPDFGGVRIEDLYVLEKNGLRQLTKSNKELIEI